MFAISEVPYIYIYILFYFYNYFYNSGGMKKNRMQFVNKKIYYRYLEKDV